MSKKRVSKSKTAAPKKKTDWFGRILRVGPLLWGGLSFLLTAFFFLIIFGLIALPAPSDLGVGNVAVLPIEGVIMTGGDAGPFGGGIASSDVLVNRIKSLKDDPTIQALVLEINSPGGSPVASDEIGAAVKQLDIPTVAVIRETGASGGYWIASAADHIIANRMSVTGSIGVVGSSFGLEGLLEDYNVSYRRLVAGRLKDAGTPYRAATQEEDLLLQKLIDTIYDEFVNEVAANRNMPREEVVELATGFVYLGSEAKELGLVDELGNMDSAVEYLETELNATVELAYFSNEPSLLDIFGGVMSENFHAIGTGIGASLRPQQRPVAMLQ